MSRVDTLPEMTLPGAEAPRFELRFGLLSDPGLARERNEDACAVFVPWDADAGMPGGDALFLVADGMGGHEAGDVASSFVAERVRSWFTARAEEGRIDEAFGEALREVLLETNAALLELARERAIPRGMGSTATVACLLGHALHVGHVGDTRLYRLRGNELDVLTKDHSWVGEQQRAGLLTEEEAERHPKKHMLTECLGVGGDVRVDVVRADVLPGDRYLLCSDGLHGPVSRREIGEALAGSGDPQQTARALVALANERDGPDNVTVVVFHLDPAGAPGSVDPSPAGAPPYPDPADTSIPPGTAGLRRWGATGGGLALVGVLLVAGVLVATLVPPREARTPVDPGGAADARNEVEATDPPEGAAGAGEDPASDFEPQPGSIEPDDPAEPVPEDPDAPGADLEPPPTRMLNPAPGSTPAGRNR